MILAFVYTVLHDVFLSVTTVTSWQQVCYPKEM